MSTSAVAAAPAAPVPLLWKLLLLLPALAHATALGWSLLTHPDTSPVEFRLLDLLVLLIVLGHVTLVLFIAGWRRGAFWLVLVTYLTLGGLFVAEVLAARAVPSSPPMVPQLPVRQTATAGLGFGEMSEQPYTYSVNSLGLRGPEMKFHEADLSILCVGGGTTECMYIPDEETWPWALQDKLAADLGQTVFVGNAGRRGFTTVHTERGFTTLNICKLLREYTHDAIPQFHWVIVLCGFDDWGNDLTITDANQLQHIRELPIPETYVYTDTSPQYYRGGLLRLLKRSSLPLNDPTGVWLSQQRSIRATLLAEGSVLNKLPENLPQLLLVYKANLKAIHQACRDRGAQLLLVTQPTLYRENLPANYQRLLWRIDSNLGLAPSLRYLERMNSAYNQAMVDFCRKEKVECLDLAGKLSKDLNLLYDDCHLTPSGCEKVSDILAAKLLEKLKK